MPPNLTAIYAEHFRGVWRNLRRLGVPDVALDDAVQDVFLVVHRRWSEFQARSSLRTWIYGIALRVARDHRRSERRHAARVERYAEAVDLATLSGSPAEEAERREATRLLHALLDKLDADQRAVFVLVELEQLSLREAAEATGMRPATCQRRLRAARAAFEAALRRTLHTDGRPIP